jgi:hypothetical protein
MSRNRLVGFIILIILGTVISQCTSADRDSSGEISKSGDLSVNETRKGDCFIDFPDVTFESTNISSVKAIPCTEPHSWQVFYKSSLMPGEYSDGAVIDASNEVCSSALDVLFASLNDLQYNEYRTADINIIQPTEKSWASGNRAVDCLIGSDTQTYYSSVLN